MFTHRPGVKQTIDYFFMNNSDSATAVASLDFSQALRAETHAE
jgi:hypothetical protein